MESKYAGNPYGIYIKDPCIVVILTVILKKLVAFDPNLKRKHIWKSRVKSNCEQIPKPKVKFEQA